MTALFNDNLIGSGDLDGRVSTSGDVWDVAAGGGLMPLSALGCRPVGAASERRGSVDLITPFATSNLTMSAVIRGSSKATSPAFWRARFGVFGVDATDGFSVGLEQSSGTISVREYNGDASGTVLASFARVASAVYNLRVEISGGTYTVFIDDAEVAGPVTPASLPATGRPELRLRANLTDSENLLYAQSVSYESSVLPEFWTSLVGTRETV